MNPNCDILALANSVTASVEEPLQNLRKPLNSNIQFLILREYQL